MTAQKSYLGPKGLILAAVGFDDQTPAVVETALSLARKTGAAVRLLNVVEQPAYDMIGMEVPGFYVLPAVIQEATDALRKERQDKMAKLVKDLRASLDLEGLVVEGDCIRATVAEATRLRANVIVTGSHAEAYRFLPRSFSTALSLMAEAPVPVLVVSGKPVDFEKDGMRLLVADDLRESTREAVRRAYELAAALPGARVRQTHVHGDFREILRDTWREHASKVPENLWVAEHEARRAAMNQQGAPFRKKAEAAGAAIELDIRSGDVGPELEAAIDDFQPTVLVFGRHETLRARPFLVGRMTFKAMLRPQLAVLVVPPASAGPRLPFPAAGK